MPLTNLSYTLQSNVPDLAKAMIRGAFDRWSGVSKLRFYETPGYVLNYIIVGFFNGYHNDAGQFDGRGRILGHAFAPESGRRMHFNVDQPWSFNPPPYPEGYYDFMTAALHKIGHALGLEHSGDRSAVMYPGLAFGEERTLTSDDILRINLLYTTSEILFVSQTFSPLSNFRVIKYKEFYVYLFQFHDLDPSYLIWCHNRIP